MRLVLGLLFVACLALSPQARAEDSLLDVVLKRDKIIVATYSTSPPLAYADEKGELVGFEIDMAREIAKDLLGDPKKVEFVVLQSDGRFPAVLSGKIDVGMCSTTITPDRAMQIARDAIPGIAQQVFQQDFEGYGQSARLVAEAKIRDGTARRLQGCAGTAKRVALGPSAGHRFSLPRNSKAFTS